MILQRWFYAHRYFILPTIMLVALGLRLALFYFFIGQDGHHMVYFDSDQYEEIAQSIVHGQGFARADGTLQSYRLPGYSLFLAGCYAGVADNQLIAMLIQLFLSLLIPLLCYQLARTLFAEQEGLALVMAAISAVHVGFIIYASMLATETLFLIFLLCFFITYFKLLLLPGSSGSCWLALCAGGVLGCASLIRPVGHYVLFVALVMLVIRRSRRCLRSIQDDDLSGRERTVCQDDVAGEGRGFVSAWLAITGPWLIRNYMLFGGLFFHTLPGLHFLQYSATKIVQTVNACSYVQARAGLLAEWQAEQEQFAQQHQRLPNEWERCQLAEYLAGSIIRQHPFLFLKNSCLEMVKTVLSLYSAQLVFADTQRWTEYTPSLQSLFEKIKVYLWPQVTTWWIAWLTLFELIMHVLLLVGSLGFGVTALMGKKALDRENFTVLLVTLPFVILFIGVTCAYGCARLRMPLEPFLLLYTVAFWRRCLSVLLSSQRDGGNT